jgi:hypothetical protein
MTRTDFLPAFAPPDRWRLLDLLDPVAPEPPGLFGALNRAARLERFRLEALREDRRVTMIRRAGR